MVKFLNVFTCIIDLPSRGGHHEMLPEEKTKANTHKSGRADFFF